MKKILLLPKTVTTHLFGAEHSHTHRICVGICVAASGLTLAYTSTMFIQPIHFMVDFFGMSLHGIGIVPIIDRINPQQE
jgi:hypothetical protein